jgi:hypothetical protein
MAGVVVRSGCARICGYTFNRGVGWGLKSENGRAPQPILVRAARGKVWAERNP